MRMNMGDDDVGIGTSSHGTHGPATYHRGGDPALRAELIARKEALTRRMMFGHPRYFVDLEDDEGPSQPQTGRGRGPHSKKKYAFKCRSYSIELPLVVKSRSTLIYRISSHDIKRNKLEGHGQF